MLRIMFSFKVSTFVQMRKCIYSTKSTILKPHQLPLLLPLLSNTFMNTGCYFHSTNMWNRNEKSSKRWVVYPKKVKSTRNSKVSYFAETDAIISQTQNQHSLMINKRHPPSTSTRKDEERFLSYDEVSEVDYLGHSLTTHGSMLPSFHAEMAETRELLKMASKVKAKTIQKKYFKPPKKPNVLTWACKERIRYLHQQDPDKWTVEQLSSAFPVSESSIVKILKSRVRLHRLEDIKEHDGYVKKNWETVHNSLDEEGEVIVDSDFVKDVLDNIGNKSSITNALPPKNKLVDKQLSMRSKISGGIFSSIVQDEIERQQMKQNLLYSEYAEDLKGLEDTLMKIKSVLAVNDESIDKASFSKPAKIPIDNITKIEKYKDESPVKIAVNLKQRDSTEFVVDGCVFDENGEFLYRIPS